MAFKKEHIPWNKGLIKYNNDSVRRISESKIGDKNPMYGKEFSAEHRKKLSEKCSGQNHPMFGKHHTKGSISKISKSRINKGLHSKEWKEEASENRKKEWANPDTRNKRLISILKANQDVDRINKISASSIKMWQNPEYRKKMQSHLEKAGKLLKELRKFQVFPNKDTSIEIKIQGFLKEIGIDFFTHQYISEISHSYQCDILIPIQEAINNKTIIECDGDYWHGNPEVFNEYNISERQREQIEEDKLRTKELIERGFKVIRMWERDIKKMTLEQFKVLVMNKLNIAEIPKEAI